jgi:hypothetical protein
VSIVEGEKVTTNTTVTEGGRRMVSEVELEGTRREIERRKETEKK